MFLYFTVVQSVVRNSMFERDFDRMGEEQYALHIDHIPNHGTEFVHFFIYSDYRCIISKDSNNSPRDMRSELSEIVILLSLLFFILNPWLPNNVCIFKNAIPIKPNVK